MNSRPPEVRQRIKEESDSEARQRRSVGIKRALANPEVRRRRNEALKRALAKPVVRQRKSEATKALWADPCRRQRWSEAMKRAGADPKLRQRKSAAMKQFSAKPEVRQRKSVSMKRAWADPGRHERWSEALQRAWNVPEARQRRVERQKALWTAERCAKLSSVLTTLWEERNAALKEASLWPADWQKKTPLWQMIAIILLSRDGYMSNEELGKIMDDAQIMCPRGYGDTWSAALSSSPDVKSHAATMLVAKVRKWIRKPGSSRR